LLPGQRRMDVRLPGLAMKRSRVPVQLASIAAIQGCRIHTSAPTRNRLA
jgi:hypothetical protein